uniref:Uncharacterized protein n=1 Tax=Tanacetum cinerariifolium TaxID=118510 RepID=A0A6L2J814_TANCI|nr:hypothetical protein [Tanacetum cinerariifolium]
MGIVPTEMELILEQTQQGISHEVSPCDLARISELYLGIHNEDGNPSSPNIKQAHGRIIKDGGEGVDIARIARKEPKPNKNGHENEKNGRGTQSTTKIISLGSNQDWKAMIRRWEERLKI